MQLQEEQISYSDMYDAYTDCRKHKKNKYGTKKFEVNALFNVIKLTDEINSRQYKISQSKCFIIKYPTKREVFCSHFRDRIVNHFIFNEINPIIEKLLIFDSANCRENKGTDFAIRRVRRFLRSCSNNYKDGVYCLKMDLSGFFMNIDRKLLLKIAIDLVNTYYLGKYKQTLLYLLPIIILADFTKNTCRNSPLSDWDDLPPRKSLFNNKNGLPIGNLCSQLFANLYLNNFDHYMKSQFRYYSRYVDDIIVLDKDKQKLKEALRYAKDYFPTINLVINDKKSRIFNARFGIQYLGVNIYYHYWTLGKRRINRMFFSVQQHRPVRDIFNSCASRIGMLRAYKGRNLAKRWYDSFPYYCKKLMFLKLGNTFKKNDISLCFRRKLNPKGLIRF